MKILADENLEAEIVGALRAAGHLVSDIKEMTPGIDDSEVLALASELAAILITNDKDFGELVFRERLFSNGVILLRFGQLEVEKRIDYLLTLLIERKEDLPNAFTVLTPTSVRIRN
ncbi:MAG: DUF5615 family PIN-like protein [Acidobacteria bacterium]|nr:DUF5615 family PIN-like protein [Acidobacteriota bacterium]